MKLFKFYPLCLALLVMFLSCSKSNPGSDNNGVLQSSSNSAQEVRAGQPNCVEAIQGNIRLKVEKDSTAASSLRILSKSEKLYPSGGYILVYELTRTTSKIVVDYKHVHTSCGNPAPTAFLPATSAPVITNLAEGTYPIEIKVGSDVNNGSLIVSRSGSARLLMQSTNGIVIE